MYFSRIQGGRLVGRPGAKPTQLPTAVEVGLGFGLSLAKIERLYDVIKHCIAANFLNVFKQT